MITVSLAHFFVWQSLNNEPLFLLLSRFLLIGLCVVVPATSGINLFNLEAILTYFHKLGLTGPAYE